MWPVFTPNLSGEADSAPRDAPLRFGELHGGEGRGKAEKEWSEGKARKEWEIDLRKGRKDVGAKEKGDDEMGKTGALPSLALPHKILDPPL